MNQSNDDKNIVDWVFIELRNSTTNKLIQTRSALLQKDGNIVETDGKTAVIFNYREPSEYTIAVKHRNHLGMAAEAVVFAKRLTANRPSVSNTFDFTTASDNQIFGTSTAYARITNTANTTVNALWAGNANFNNNIRYTGLQNDKDFILINTLSNIPTRLLSNVYHPADLNMDRIS